MNLGFIFVMITEVLSAKALNATAKGMEWCLSQNTYSIVLLYSSKSQITKANRVFDVLAHRSEGRYGVIMADISKDKELKEKFGVLGNYEVGIYYKTEFRFLYHGDHSPDKLSAYMNEIIDDHPVTYLKSLSETVSFMKQEPANLIIYDNKLADKAEKFAEMFSGMIRVGVVTSDSVAEILKLNAAEVRRPLEGFEQKFNNDEVSEQGLQKAATSAWKVYESQEFVTRNAPGRKLVCALFDKNSSWHIARVSEVLNRVSAEIDHNKVEARAIDFFDAPRLVSQFGVFKFAFPLFFVCGRNFQDWEVFTDPLASATETFFWAREKTTGEKAPTTKENLIPQLFAQDFMGKVLTPDKDVILFVAAPGMEGYRECRKNAELFAEIFKDAEKIEFYEYNPRTEHVQGLQIPKSETPQFSIWPATPTPSGSAFKANYELTVMFESLVKILRADIPEDIAKACMAKAKELIPGLSEKMGPAPNTKAKAKTKHN